MAANSALAALDAVEKSVAAGLLVDAINAMAAACQDGGAISLGTIVAIQDSASAAGLATEDRGLSAAQTQAKLDGCFRAVMDPIVLPTPLSLISEQSLNARAMLKVANNPNPELAVFAFTITATDATVTTPSGNSDLSGRYTTVFKRTGPDIAFRVRACVVAFVDGPKVRVSDVCVEQIVRPIVQVGPESGAGIYSGTIFYFSSFGSQGGETLEVLLRVSVNDAGDIGILSASGTVQRLASGSNIACQPAFQENNVKISTVTSAELGIRPFGQPKFVKFFGTYVQDYFHPQTISPDGSCTGGTEHIVQTTPVLIATWDDPKVIRDANGKIIAVELNPLVGDPSSIKNTLLKEAP